ncbi:MAG: TolC family protein [Oligoflexales bacterium]
MKRFGFLCSIFVFASAGKSQAITLEEYLNEVRNKHQGYKASDEAKDGAKLKAEDGSLIFAPNVFANVQQSVDEKPPANPATGDKLSVGAASVGVGKMFSSGTQAKISYNMTHIDMANANPQAVPMAEAYEGKPVVEVSQPLWRNFFGKEVRAAADLSREQANATKHTEAFKQKMILAEAEGIYWRLALARDAVAIQKDSLERARKTKQWSAGRVKLSLGDKADMYQADTAVKAKELELQMAVDEEQAAARAFNAARGIASSAMTDPLQKIDAALVGSIKVPKKVGTRGDVEAAKAYKEIASLSAELNEEKYRPTLELFGSYAYNSREEELGDATSNSFKSDYPTTVVGLRLSAPLGRDIINNSRAGYRKDEAAAAMNAERKAFEVEQQWNDSVERLEQAKKRLNLALDVEKIQREKLEYERNRLRRGRTTTYQVIVFEQDYATSQLNRIRAQADILRIAAQLKTFGDET